MNRHEMSCEDLRRPRIRQPSAILRTIARQHGKGMVRIANPIDVEWQASRTSRTKQEMLQFLASLVVSPVSDPHETTPLSFVERRPEEPRISPLVPHENARAPAPAAI